MPARAFAADTIAEAFLSLSVKWLLPASTCRVAAT